MGRVRTKTIKKASRIIIEKYYTKLTLDFHTNKRICEEIAIIPTKPLRNKIAGFVTHLMKRLRYSQVRGISIKLQEEERERRDNFVPDVSALEQDVIEVDPETKEMLKMLDFPNIPGLQLIQPTNQPYGSHMTMECPHVTDNVKIQSSVINEKDNSKEWQCAECSSRQQTWMCLHCGVVSCGRYVKAHALAHSESLSNHTICMDCENLTVFCYACNDYIVNDTPTGNIAHLREQFLRSGSKSPAAWPATCEIISESDPMLNRRNLRPRTRKRSHSNDSSSAGSSENVQINRGRQKRKVGRTKSQSKREKRVVGLRNLGNTCFMNAVLQSLSNIEEFCVYFKKLPSLESIKNRHKLYQSRSFKELKDAIMAEELRKILINLTDQGTKGAISPESLFLVIWKVVPRYRGYQQQDAHEFLRYMLDRLHIELLHLLPDFSLKDSQYISHKNKTSIVTSVFGGMLQSEVRCLNCGTESKKHDPFLDLSLDIPEKCHNQRKCKETGEDLPPCNILDCLTSFIEVEELAETELYYCSNCKSKQRSTKRFWIRRLPNVLCLHLKRFRWNNFFRTKVDTHVEFPVIALDMSQFVLSDLPDTRSSSTQLYDLAAVIVHHGGGSGCGHYTAFAINDGQWFHFNDSMVRPTETEIVAKCKPYILFYIRREFRLPSVKS